MRRTWLTVLFVVLVVYDIWSIGQLIRTLFDHGHRGGASFWVAFLLIAAFHAGIIWLTVRIGKRLRSGVVTTQ